MTGPIESKALKPNPYVELIMQKEQIKLKQLENKQELQDVRITLFSQIKNLIDIFRDNIKKTTDSFNTLAYTASTGDADILTAKITTNTNITPATHTLNVTQLATSETISGVNTFADKSVALGLSGDLTFTVGAESYTVNVTTDDTLDQIRGKINTASDNTGVTASIISSTTPGGDDEYSLVISSNKTGVINKVVITGDLEASFDFSNQINTAQDAEFTFDGLSVVRAENTINDVMEGITFSLHAVGTSTLDVKLDETNKQEAVKVAVKDFVSGFNKVIGVIDQAIAQSAVSNQSINTIKSQIKDVISSELSGVGEFTSIYDLGIKVAKPLEYATRTDATYTGMGQLEIDETKFNEIINSNLDDLETFFTDPSSGLLKVVDDKVKQLADFGGLIPASITTLKEENSRIGRLITNEQSRLTNTREILEKRFYEVDNIIKNFENVSVFMDQQLASLSFGRKK